MSCGPERLGNVAGTENDRREHGHAPPTPLDNIAAAAPTVCMGRVYTLPYTAQTRTQSHINTNTHTHTGGHLQTREKSFTAVKKSVYSTKKFYKKLHNVYYNIIINYIYYNSYLYNISYTIFTEKYNGLPYTSQVGILCYIMDYLCKNVQRFSLYFNIYEFIRFELYEVYGRHNYNNFT